MWQTYINVCLNNKCICLWYISLIKKHFDLRVFKTHLSVISFAITWISCHVTTKASCMLSLMLHVILKPNCFNSAFWEIFTLTGKSEGLLHQKLNLTWHSENKALIFGSRKREETHTQKKRNGKRKWMLWMNYYFRLEKMFIELSDEHQS